MSYVSLTGPHQVTTRKDHRCGWCNEMILKGTPDIWARSFIFEEGPQSEWMHPECYEAMNEIDFEYISDGWIPGDFARGSTESY